VDEWRRVILISDHPLFREGLARVLNGSDGYRVVGQVSSVEQALEVVAVDRLRFVAGRVARDPVNHSLGFSADPYEKSA
jgi:hypothetical protein